MELTFGNSDIGKRIQKGLQWNFDKWPRVAGNAYDKANQHLYEEVFSEDVLDELGEASGVVFQKWGERFSEEHNGRLKTGICGGRMEKSDGKGNCWTEWVPFGIRVGKDLNQWLTKQKRSATPQSAGENPGGQRLIRTVDKKKDIIIIRPQIVIMFEDPAVYEWYRTLKHQKMKIKGVTVETMGIESGNNNTGRVGRTPNKAFIEMKDLVEQKSGQKIRIVPIMFEMKYKERIAAGSLTPVEALEASRYYDKNIHESDHERRKWQQKIEYLDNVSDELVTMGHRICTAWQGQGHKF